MEGDFSGNSLVLHDKLSTILKILAEVCKLLLKFEPVPMNHFNLISKVSGQQDRAVGLS